MKLIAGNTYRVTIVLTKGPKKEYSRSVYYGDSPTTMTATMTYCGGSQVDDDGHYVCGGTWAKGEHPDHRYFRSLAIVGIRPTRGLRPDLPDRVPFGERGSQRRRAAKRSRKAVAV